MPKGFEGFQKGHKLNLGNTSGRANKGKVHSPEILKKQRDSHIGTGKFGGLSKTNPFRAMYAQTRRARVTGVGGSFTVAEWETLKAQYNWTCPACHRPEPEIKLTIDHVIPVIKGGSNNIENIQPLCGSCNSKKSRKIILYPKV